MTVIGVIVFEKSYDWVETISEAIWIIGFILAFATAVATFALVIEVSSASTLDEEIEMYQAENEAIEDQIASVVQQYQKYESDIFMEVAPDNSVALVALYPELKSDSLVQKQIEIYVSNNEHIKSLKSDQISASIWRWWLYFGN